MTSNPQSNYRWYILTLAIATNIFAIAAPISCMPVLFKEITDDLGLSLVQVGTIWGIGPLSRFDRGQYSGCYPVDLAV